MDPSTEQIILDIPSAARPPLTHNGGTLTFGPDGYLYISIGDEARSNFNAQDNTNLRGTVLRIDVDAGQPYAIPPDNPLVGTEFRPEIYAWGFRNPFRMSFDDSGRLWLSDVGGDHWEEVDIVEKGGNYGWPKMEGSHCRLAPCDDPSMIDPVSEYSHELIDPTAVGGGAVYHGTLFPDLVGKFIYADIVTGRAWAVSFDADGNPVTEQVSESIGGNNRHLTVGPDGELYAIQGFKLVRLVPRDPDSTSGFPTRVSDIGCFDPADPSRPGPAMIPYEINVPFWSDGANKSRWMVIPDGERITIDDEGRFILPVGSMLFKNFRLGPQGKLTETRMLVRHADGGWAGYTYEWDSAETDGTLVASDGKETVKVGQPYTYPSRTGCIQCHNQAATFALGPEVMELNRSIVYPSTGIHANQLETYEAIGLLATPLGADPADLPALPETTDTSVPLEQRARAYLHSNCATCHRPGGPGRGGLDMRFPTPTQDTGMIDSSPTLEDFGIANAKIVAPGDPDRSILAVRMGSRSPDVMMPPLGSHIADANGVSLIRTWISSITTGNEAPSVSLVSPSDGASFFVTDAVAMEAIAEDGDGDVVNVEFFIDGVKAGEDDVAPYVYQWGNPTEGSHVLTAVATDDQGATTTSTPVAIVVEPIQPNIPPSVDISTPSDGEDLPVGSVVVIEASANDIDGQVSKVEFFANGIKLGEDSSAPYRYDWIASPVGEYRLVAIATDDQGASTASNEILVTVLGGNQQSNVILRDGLNGYVGTQDAFLFKGHPSMNYGVLDELRDRLSAGPADFRSLVRFKVFQSEGGPVPDGAVITSARLRLYKYSPYAASYRLGMLKSDWEESEVSWDKRSNGVFWQGPGASLENVDVVDSGVEASIGFDPGWLVFDVTASLQAMSLGAENYGWKLTPDTAGNAKRFYSREYGADETLRPTLEISYTTTSVPLGISIEAPLAGDTLQEGELVPIKANLTGNAGGVSQVEFFANGIKIGDDDSQPYSLLWLADQSGDVVLEARATGIDGEVVTSTPVTVSISPISEGPLQIVLQDGLGGYMGTRDAYVWFFRESYG